MKVWDDPDERDPFFSIRHDDGAGAVVWALGAIVVVVAFVIFKWVIPWINTL